MTAAEIDVSSGNLYFCHVTSLIPDVILPYLEPHVLLDAVGYTIKCISVVVKPLNALSKREKTFVERLFLGDRTSICVVVVGYDFSICICHAVIICCDGHTHLSYTFFIKQWHIVIRLQCFAFPRVLVCANGYVNCVCRFHVPAHH